MAEWYKDLSFYQIWPRSFMDGNGDGIGDIAGVMEKLDYLQNLGVDGIWFSPLYPSPNADFGYDVADYMDIHPDYGTLEEFRALLGELHRRGMKLLMDLVINHTSDEHPWFQASRRRVAPYTDYYIWRPAGKNGKLPNNWDSLFEGKAWEWDDVRGEYYLHLFAKKQPDLNMDNPAVRSEVERILRFWLDLGVDGFREDVITFISKADGLPDDHLMPAARGLRFYSCGPRLHAYLRQFRAVTDQYDCVTVGEAARMSPRKALQFVGGENRVLDMFINFEHMGADCFMVDHIRRPFSLIALKKALRRWQTEMRGKGWNMLYLENHDHPRVISRYGSEKYRVESGKMLAAMYLLLQGTAFVYQGQELGMTNLDLPSLADYPDVFTQNNYLQLKPVVGEKRALRWTKAGSRVSARTPVQWTDGENAGFSPPGVQPWLTVNPNYREVNAASQTDDPDSLLNFYRALLRFRKQAVIRHGSYREYSPSDRRFYIYERAYEGERILVVCSFTEKQTPFPAPYPLDKAEKLFGNYPGLTAAMRPYEVRVYRLPPEQSGEAPAVRRINDYGLVKQIYLERMTKDFPANELIPIPILQRLWDSGAYDCFGLYEGTRLLGYAFFVRQGRNLLLDYLAVADDRRGQGLGSAFLRQLGAYLTDTDCVVLEVEDPDKATDDTDRALRERRVQFYLRNGCALTALRSELFGAEYRLLTGPGTKTHESQTLRRVYTDIYRLILPPDLFQNSFHMD